MDDFIHAEYAPKEKRVSRGHSPMLLMRTRVFRMPSNSKEKLCSEVPKSSLPPVMATTLSLP